MEQLNECDLDTLPLSDIVREMRGRRVQAVINGKVIVGAVLDVEAKLARDYIVTISPDIQPGNGSVRCNIKFVNFV